jgi:hypothetical protein
MKARREVTGWSVALTLMSCASAADAGMVLSPWEYDADMSVAQNAFASAVAGGDIYAMGGSSTSDPYGTNRVHGGQRQ